MNIKNQLLSVFGVSLVLTLVLSGVFVGFTGKVSTGLEDLHTYQEETAEALENFRDAELVLLNNAWEMKYLDEARTHTITRYIQSGGQSYWAGRYLEQDEQMTTALASAEDMATAEDLKTLASVKTAGAKLADYDAHIISLVEEGVASSDDVAKEAKFKAAAEILVGDYDIQKAIYYGGMRSFFTHQQERLDESIDLRVAEAHISMVKAQGLINDAKDGQTKTVLLIGAIVAVNAVLALRFSNSLTSRIGQLTKVSEKLSIGEIEGLSVDISGNDEIGDLGEAMKGVVAAFNTMLTGFDEGGDSPVSEEYEVVDTVEAVDEVEVR